ncbi:hypothetical protein [Hyphococcus luteus]|uniref:hypothetical protein n=1 Tax=Hyphococcus luteus TaxID=2058213 RepID=UPI001057159A|nr:hypothetical protein [Marinicaulis flavus]
MKSILFAGFWALLAGGVFDVINVAVKVGLDGKTLFSSVCLLNGPKNGCGGVLLFYFIMFAVFLFVGVLRFHRKK